MTRLSDERWGWGQWDPSLRRQVACSGRVTIDGRAADDIEVRADSADLVRPQVTTSRPDGIYFFLDLPAGSYVVTAEDRRGRYRGHGVADVSWQPNGDIRRAVVDLPLVEVAPSSPALPSSEEPSLSAVSPRTRIRRGRTR